MRAETACILLEAAAAGVGGRPGDHRACAIKTRRRQQPSADGPDPDDRAVRLGTTFGGAVVIRGNPTRNAPPPSARSWKPRRAARASEMPGFRRFDVAAGACRNRSIA
jgi:hypothetical protein